MAPRIHEMCNSIKYFYFSVVLKLPQSAQVSKYLNGYQWARLSFASTLHVENKIKFKLTCEEKCYKEDQILSNLPSSFKYQEQIN